MKILKKIIAALVVSCFHEQLFAACSTEIARNKPDIIYKDYGNGMVMDTKTRLIWQKCSMGQAYSGGACVGDAASYSWDQAISITESANESSMLGYNDWRIPNAKELLSLSDFSCDSPSINEMVFPMTPAAGRYWSSTPVASLSNRIWIANLSTGILTTTFKSANTVALRLVRN